MDGQASGNYLISHNGERTEGVHSQISIYNFEKKSVSVTSLTFTIDSMLVVDNTIRLIDIKGNLYLYLLNDKGSLVYEDTWTAQAFGYRFCALFTVD